ncbi:hypothetical protein B0H14DRAFT_2915353 [Mycena olivaceomarginata]|nr:hypothetical protein B0H14DRAFT_2915353 [Mycena olivaceomarginata]
MQNGPPPPPHWHAQSYAAAVSAPAQTPIGNTHYGAQGYHRHDGRGPDGPVNADDQYQFSLRPVTTTTQSIPIDPALQRSTKQVPFVHPQHHVDHEHRPRSKKPDVCAKPSQKPKKNKGKGKAHDASPSSESDADNACSKARNSRSGVRNYNKADKEMLFSIVQQLLLTGEKGWKVVESSYNEMACKAGRQERAFSSLKAKHSLYTKQKKPTGEGERPPDVRRTHEIKDLINDKACMRDINDDSKLEDNDSSDLDVPKVVEPVRSTIARRAASPAHMLASPPLHQPCTSAADAVNTLVRSLDPAALRARNDARMHHLFERTQFMMLSSQLDGLRSQISALQQENNDLKCEWDRAEMERTWAARFDEVMAHGRSHDQRGRSCSPSYPRRHVRTDIKYLEGSGMTVWETDTSSDTTDFDYRAKKKQCRYQSPTPYQHHILNHCRTPSPSPPCRLATVHPAFLLPLPPPTSATLVSGNAVELVVTPHRGSAPLGFIISPNV